MSLYGLRHADVIVPLAPAFYEPDFAFFWRIAHSAFS